VADITKPIARSPIPPVGRSTIIDGWERAIGVAHSGLRLCDLSFLAKVQVQVHASESGSVAARLGAELGRAVRDSAGRLVVASGPGEWFVLSSQGQGPVLAKRLTDLDGRVSAVDLTHGRALMRLTGAEAVRGVLSKQCAINFAEKVVPNGAALRSSVASVTTDIIRDDLGGERSYLLHCERSSGQYLFDALLDAGADYGIVACGATDADW